MYRVIRKFFDIEQNHAYFVGDKFPHNDDEISSERIQALEGCKNKLGAPLIERVEKPKAQRKNNK